MNRIRIFQGFILAIVLTACEAVPLSFGVTSTPSTTSTPEAPPLPTGTATPPPVPTIPPLTRVQSGEQALFYGDYDTARYHDGGFPQSD